MEALTQRIGNYINRDFETLAVLHALHSRIEKRAAGESIITEGDIVEDTFVIEEGWAIRFRLLDDGRRQILNFMLPGDCFDLMAFTRAQSDHSVSAATDVTLRRVKTRDFISAIQTNPKLTTAFLWISVQEEAILREQIIRVGRRSAQESIGHLILELNRRFAAATGRLTDYVDLPIQQSLLADALGLSVVHISRTLKQLRLQGYIETTVDGIVILDRPGLALMSNYDSRYLHLEKLGLKLAA